MKHNYLWQSTISLFAISLVLITATPSNSQQHKALSPQPQKASQGVPVQSQAPSANTVPAANSGQHNGEEMEELYFKYLSLDLLQQAAEKTGASADEKTLFEKYYHDKIYGEDKMAFYHQVKDDAGIQSFADEKLAEYVGLFEKFKTIEKDYPSTINEYTATPALPPIACQTACDNIDFENGTLSGWYAYYATNTSTVSGYSNSALTGGAAGAVTKAAGPDANSNNSYQVEIMHGAGVDPIAGAFIPVVCPTGGNYSVRIGDSTNHNPQPNAQMGVLEQKFNVTAANENFVFMYAVVLENPSHNVFEQPYFNVETLDQNGNPIPGCGQYQVVSGPGLPGYKAFYYATNNDTVYCKPWTTVYLPLKAYIGTCVTIKVIAADCSLGGHFGYAYFDAQCSPGVISSSPVICGNNVTLTAPSGSASYHWMGPCIVGPTTNQTCTVSCAGTYSVVLTSNAGPSCTDTLTMNVAASTSPAPTISSTTNVKCHGAATGSATVNVTGGTSPYTYNWTPSGGTGATASNLTAGTYTCTVTDVNGCTGSVSVTLTQPTVLTASISASTMVACNGASTGSATVTAGGGVTAYTYAWSPSGGTNATATGLSAATYTVTVTDNNGCTATASIAITQPTAVTANITSATNVSCNGQSNGSATVTAGGGVPAYTYAWAPGGGTNATKSSLTAGTYTVTVTDSHGCTATASVNITQPAVLTANISGSNPVSCHGGNDGSATVTAGGGTTAYTYNWTPSGGTSSVANNLAAGTYTVTITDAHGCTATASIVITQPAASLAANITATTNVACNGQNNGSATVTASGGTPGYTYNWNPSSATSATATGLGPGTYTVTVTDAHSCSATASVTITQPPVLTANITASTNVSCHGGTNGSATVTAGGGTTNYTYNWAPSGGTGTTASSLTAGTYTVTVTDAHGCTATASITLTQPTSLTVNITGNNPVSCHGGSDGSLTATAGGGTSAYTYNWTPSGGTSSVANNLTAGTYTITVTDAHGCTATASATVTQPTVLTANITASSNVTCNGANNGSATVTAGGGTPGYAYNWNPSSGTTATVTGLGPGTYTVTVTDANACSATATVTITQPAVLTANITASTNVSCHGGNNGSATVTAGGGTAAYTYAWAPGGGTNATDNGLTAGTYTVTVTDAHGCTATTSISITQPATLTANISSSSNPNCNGGGGSATVTAGGGTTNYTYNWTPSGGTSATATGITAGTYTVTVTDAHGCTATASVTITQPTALTVSNGSIQNISCNGGNNGSITATAGGGTPGYNYNWTPSGGTNATASSLTAGTYTVTVTDANGCTATANTTLTQPTVLTANITASTNIKCNGAATGSATVTAGGGTTAYTYNWAPSGGTNATATNLTAGSYTVTVTDANGCTATANVTLTQPTAITTPTSFTSATCGSSNGSATVTPAGGTPGYTYSWAPSGGTNATATGLSGGTYTVTVKDANNCSVTAAVSVPDAGGPTVNITSSTNILCNGAATGSANSSASGGTAPYTYNWSPSGGTNANATGLTAGTYTIAVTDHNGCVGTASVTITQPTAVTVTINPVVEVKCNGQSTGKATANASGGTGAYTYNWTPSGGTNALASNLSAGTYTITVTDHNGCTGTALVTITQPTALAVAMSHTNVSCNGGNNGTAKGTASGGTPGYTYSWSPSGGTNATASNLTAGTYTITVTDANGCTVTGKATVTQPTLLTVSTGSIVNASCNGQSNGSATATAAGGTTPYTYAWTPSGGTNATATGLSAGTYTITVTDHNGCTATATATITQPTTLTASISSVTNINCNGNANGSITVTAGGGTVAYTYAWAPSGGTNSTASNLSPGTYTVTVTDAHGCTATASASITQPAALTSSITTEVDNKCFGQSQGSATVTAGGGTTNYTYNWAPSGGTNATASNLSAGTYTVTVTDAHGCTSTVSVSIAQPVLLTDTISSLNNVNCFGGNNGNAFAAPSGGTTPYTFSWSPSGQTNAGATGLTAGSYTVTVKDANGCTVTSNAVITQPAAALAVSISSVTNVDCNGNNDGSITTSTSGGTSAYTYNWAPSGGTNSSATNLGPGTYTVTVTDAHGCTATATATITQPTVLNANITSEIDVKCFGNSTGSSTVTAGGGTTNYTYNWSNGETTSTATGLSAGNYTVTVTDAHGCTATATVGIGQPTRLTDTIQSATNINCNGGNSGNAFANPSGGTVPYTYSWSPGGQTNAGATGLTAGSYTVTVTDGNGCTVTSSVTLTQPPVLTSTINSITNVTCNSNNDGSASVNAGGGTPAYSYVWSPGGQTNANATGLSQGTYTITVTDANGCTSTASATITQPAVLSASISSVTNVDCNGNNNGSATVLAGGGTSPYSYSWVPSGGASATATGLPAGSYTVTVTDAHGCSTVANVTITEPPPLIANITRHVDEQCNGDSNGFAQITVGGGTVMYTYNWTNGSTTDSISNLTAGTYTVTITDNHGCTTTASVSITQPAAPLVTSITTITNVSCNGNSNGSAYATTSGGTLPYTYSWTGGAGTSDTALNMIAGTYTLTVSGAHGCSATASFTITQPNPLVTSTSFTQATCGANNGSATVNVSGGTTGYTYLWNPGGATSATATGLTGGSYSVTITDANGCQDSASVVVTNAGGGTANITTSVNVACNNTSSGMAIVGMTGGTGPFTYSWSNSATSDTAANLTAGVYTVTVTDRNGCISITTDTITQPPALIPDPAVTAATCGTSNGQIAITVSGGSPGYTYNWSTGNTTSSQTGLSAGTYTVVVIDNNGCLDSLNINLPNKNGPNPVISSSANIPCNGGSSGSATVTVSGGVTPYTYNWSPSGGTSTIATGLTAGAYTVTVTDSNGCINFAQVVITQPNALYDSLGKVQNVTCNGQNNGYAIIIPQGGTGPYSYNWTNGGVNDSIGGLTAGSYTVTTTDANGCVAKDSVTIIQPPPIVQSIFGKDSICLGSSTIIWAGTAQSYLWSTGATTDSITVNPVTTTSYTVHQTSGSCSDSVVITVVVAPPLIANMKKADTACFGQPIQVGINVTSGVSPYTYAWNNGLPNGPGLFTVNPAGPIYYICTVTDACGHSITDSTKVTGGAAPVASFTPTPDTILGGEFVSFVNNSTNGNSWYWTFGDGSSATDSMPFHQYETAGDYTVWLVVHGIGGCIDSTSKQIVVQELFSVPNVFTPNGDGKNDAFHVTASNIKTYSISIFNRWGELIFTSNDPNIDWTGRSNAGIEESDGVYYYTLQATSYSGKTYNLKGYVQLIR